MDIVLESVLSQSMLSLAWMSDFYVFIRVIRVNSWVIGENRDIPLKNLSFEYFAKNYLLFNCISV